MNPISPSGPYARLAHPRPNPSHANYPFYTPGGGDKRWLGSGEVEEEGLQWVGGMMCGTSPRIVYRPSDPSYYVLGL